MGIPRIIHQVWFGRAPRPEAEMVTWREQHPDWEYRLWTEENLPKLRLARFWHRLDWPGRSDLARYEILLAHGGVYVDADAECVKPIDPIVDQVNASPRYDSFVVAESERYRPGLLANGFIGVPAGSLMMQMMIEGLERRYPYDMPDGAAWVLTGPGAFTPVARLYRRVRVLPSHTFLPRHFIDFNEGRPGYQGSDVYARHYWGASRAQQGRDVNVNPYVTGLRR